jgi:hypothetical protein
MPVQLPEADMEADLEACQALSAELLAALERIANEPCDHGPGPFCPRLLARAAIAQAKGE